MKNKVLILLSISLLTVLIVVVFGYQFYSNSHQAINVTSSDESSALKAISGEVYKKVSVTTSNNKKMSFLLMKHDGIVVYGSMGLEESSAQSFLLWKIIDGRAELIYNQEGIIIDEKTVGDHFCPSSYVDLYKNDSNIVYTVRTVVCEGEQSLSTHLFNFDGKETLAVKEDYLEFDLQVAGFSTHHVKMEFEGECKSVSGTIESSSVFKGFTLDKKLISLKEKVKVQCYEDLPNGYMHPDYKIRTIEDSKISFTMPNRGEAEIEINAANFRNPVTAKILD